MSDNPRASAPPSSHPQMPVSNSSGGGGNISGYSNQPAPHSGGSSGPNHKTLLISAAITVMSSLIIYYLTTYLNRPKAETSPLVMKEATIDAWKSYVAYENLYTTNSLVMEKEMKVNPAYDFMGNERKESAKFVKDLSSLKSKKNVDIDLLNVFDHRLENEASTLQELEKYVHHLDSLKNTNMPTVAQTNALLQEVNRYNLWYKGAYERAVNDIKLIAQTLNDRYGPYFKTEDMLIIQIAPQKMKSMDSALAILNNQLNTVLKDPASQPLANEPVAKADPSKLPGHWADGKNKIWLNADGTMQYVLAMGEQATGTWSYEEGKLKLNAVLQPGGSKRYWLFTVSQWSENAFTISLDGVVDDEYHLKREKN